MSERKIVVQYKNDTYEKTQDYTVIKLVNMTDPTPGCIVEKKTLDEYIAHGVTVVIV